MNNFDEIINRRGTNSIKVDIFDADVIAMWVADMDFRSPQAIIDAIKSRADHGVFGYSGDPAELRQTIVQRMADRYNWQIKPEDIVFIPGVVSALNTGIRAYGEPGDNVLMTTPVYPPFLSAPAANRQENNEVELKCIEQDGILRYEVDFDAFEAAINDKTHTFALCHPHNPTGRIWSEDELKRMAEICIKHDVVMISDEIHCDLVFQKHTPMAALSEEIAQHTVTLMAPSKTYNIPSLGFSFAIIQNEALRHKFEAAEMGVVPHVGVFGYTAALAAYQHGDEWLTAALDYMRENRDIVTHYIRDNMPQIKQTIPEGTYLTWLDVREFAIEVPAEGIDAWIDPFFLREARVGLNKGAIFGQPGVGFARFNFACPRAILIEALDRMRDAIARRDKLD